MSDNFFSRAIRERKRFWDPDAQTDEFRADWSNRERIWITRNISFFISYALRNAPLRPNHVTNLWVVLGILGALFLACPHYSGSALGILFLYSAWILDNVDGELARYHQDFSDEGNFTDMVGHQVICPLLFAALTCRAYQEGESAGVLLAGLLATALVTPLTKMQENVDLLRAFAELKKDRDFLFPLGEEERNAPPEKKEGNEIDFADLAKKTSGFLFTHCAILYLLILAVLFGKTEAFLVFYGAGIPLFFVPKYLARRGELARCKAENLSLKDDVRAEWLDGKGKEE